MSGWTSKLLESNAGESQFIEAVHVGMNVKTLRIKSRAITIIWYRNKACWVERQNTLYIYIYIYIFLFIYIYIYIYKGPWLLKKRMFHFESLDYFLMCFFFIYTFIYIYMYVYVYIYIYIYFLDGWIKMCWYIYIYILILRVLTFIPTSIAFISKFLTHQHLIQRVVTFIPTLIAFI